MFWELKSITFCCILVGRLLPSTVGFLMYTLLVLLVHVAHVLLVLVGRRGHHPYGIVASCSQHWAL